LDNPLAWYTDEEIYRRAQEFYDNLSLDGFTVETLIRGAQLAKYHDGFNIRADESDAEREALNSQLKWNFWKESGRSKLAILTCCVGAVLRGWVQSSLVGANQAWPTELINFKTEDPTALGPSVWVYGVVNSATHFAAAICGTWLCDPLTELGAGRRGTLFVGGVFTFAASIGSAFASNWQSLLASRIVLGVGVGIVSPVVLIFVSEVCHPIMSGKILASWQTFTALGTALSASANIITHKNWRLQVGSPAIPAILLLLLPFAGTEYVHLDAISTIR
jgi:MFS family permease